MTTFYAFVAYVTSYLIRGKKVDCSGICDFQNNILIDIDGLEGRSKIFLRTEKTSYLTSKKFGKFWVASCKVIKEERHLWVVAKMSLFKFRKMDLKNSKILLFQK